MDQASSTIDLQLRSLRSVLSKQNPVWASTIQPDIRSADQVHDQLVGLVGSAPSELVAWFTWKLGPGPRDSSPEVFLGSRALPLGDPKASYYQSIITPEKKVALFSRRERRFAYAQVVPGAETVEIWDHHLEDPPTLSARSLTEYLQCWIDFATSVVLWDPEINGWKPGVGLPAARAAEVQRVLAI